MENINEKSNVNETMALLPQQAVMKALDIDEKTLRLYEKQGNITPQKNEKNESVYSLKDLECLKSLKK